MNKIKKSNENLVTLIHRLRKEKKPFWKNIAHMLSKPGRNSISVNISKLDKYGKDGVTVVVPGKVLGDGRITKKMTVAAFRFSSSAERMIKESGGKTITLLDLVDSKTEPKDILLVC